MRSNPELSVDDVLAMCTRVVGEYEPSLAAVGLVADVPESSRAGKRVEIVFPVRRDGDIHDMMEFAVIENGHAVCSLAELENWLRGALDDAIKRAVEGN